MKINFFLSVMTTAAMMITLSSCTKGENDLTVIDSEVLEEGISKTVTQKTINNPDGTTSTSLSYESWIQLKVQTKAISNSRVSVMVDNQIPEISEERTVVSFDLKDYTSQIENLYLQEYQQDNNKYVFVTDSIMNFRVEHGVFNISFRLPYKVPIYNDGITKQKMPYYRYTDVKDLGYTLTQMDSKVKDGVAYACRLYTHKIEVCFNNVFYTISAKVVLMRELGRASEPYIVRSTMTASNVLWNEFNFVSKIGVKQKWSTGEEKSVEHKVDLFAEVDKVKSLRLFEVTADVNSIGVKKLSIEYVSSYLEPYVSNPRITIEKITEECVVDFELFSVSVPLYRERAFYDDVVMSAKMAEPEYSTEGSEVKNLKIDFYENQSGKHLYKINFDVVIRIKGIPRFGSYEGFVVINSL